jgi:hypothetical protein
MSPRGAGHAIRSRRRVFREGPQLSTWHHFELHFGSILGAQVATILLFGRPGVQIGAILGHCFIGDFGVDFQGPARCSRGGRPVDSERVPRHAFINN